MMKIDLHTHSSHSDGQFTPKELLHRAKKANIDVLSLTDHDTVAGVPEAVEVGEQLGITVIKGIELSAIKKVDVHILGYGIDCNSKELIEGLRAVRDMRTERNKLIIEKLNEHGFSITDDELSEYTIGKVAGRTHIGELMVRRGYVSSVKDAFDRYLGNGAKCFVSALRLTPEDAISLVLDSGGVPVLAHPNQLRLSRADTENFIEELAACGLKGIEGFYYTHTKSDVQFYSEVAKKYSLIMTGGSDYHGTNRNSFLGKIPENDIEKIVNFLKR